MYLPDVNERFDSRRIVFRDRYNVLRVNRCYSVYVILLRIKFLDALNDCFQVIVHVEWVE